MDILFCSLTPDMSNDELKQCIHKMYPKAIEAKQGFLLTISGYDNDPRGLWEIPEVVTFFQRLIDIGFLSLLALTAQAVMDTPGDTPGFGATELWMIATGKITHRAKFPILPEYVKEVMKIVLEGNEKIAKIIEEPCPNAGIKEHEERFGRNSLHEIGKRLRTIDLLRGQTISHEIPDAPQRHGSWWNKKGEISDLERPTSKNH